MYMNKQINNPVFEMILNTKDGEAKAGARQSDFRLPENWHEEQQEGQLAIDVAETAHDLIFVSTIAGALPEKLEVYLHNDLLTIRGVRVSPIKELTDNNFFHQECYWGKFSRTIVLPVDVKADVAKAEYNNGVLLVKVPKQKMNTKVEVVVVDD